MELRWLFVFVIVGWFAYQVISPQGTISDLWIKYHLHIKFVACIIIIGIILFIPSLENILKQNNSFAESIRQVVFRDYYSKDIEERIQSGNQLVSGELPANTPTYEIKENQPNTIEISPVLRNKIAASQHWRCTKCYNSLQSDFSIINSGAICKKCVNST